MNSRRTALWATLALLTTFSMAYAQRDDDPPREGQRGPRDGERENRGPRDGDRPFGRGFGGPTNPLVEAIDTDGDGDISAQELEGAVAALKTLDENKNGILERGEMRPDFSRFARDRGPREDGDRPRPEGDRPREEGDRPRPEGDRPRAEGDRPRGEGDRPPGGRFGGDRERGPGGGAAGFVARLMENDTDKDGKLSREELMKAAESFGSGGAGRFGRGGRGGRGGPGGDRPDRPARPE